MKLVNSLGGFDYKVSSDAVHFSICHDSMTLVQYPTSPEMSFTIDFVNTPGFQLPNWPKNEAMSKCGIKWG